MDSEQNKKDFIYCIACLGEFEKTTKNGIMCPQFHFICAANGCEKNFLDSEMVLKQEQIKCPVCFVEIDYQPILQKLNCKELSLLLKNLSKRPGGLNNTLNEGEIIMFCSFCEYFEICEEKHADEIVFFECKRPPCERKVCIGCKKEVKFSSYGVRNIEDTDFFLYNERGEHINRYFEHCKCIELKKVKEDIEKAIESALTVPCPNCGLAGRKDENCTHMTCSKCKTAFCYICGKDEYQVDAKSGAGRPLFRHNIDWENNDKRCPMYFMQISDIDQRWPNKSDEECLNYFHSMRIRIKLRELMKTYFLDKKIALIREAEKQFSTIKKIGVAFDSLYSSQSSLIKRLKKK